MGLTGQLCFDFMVVSENGRQVAYPIECNPRVHTQCTVYHSDESRALFGRLLLADNTAPVTKERLIDQMEIDFPLVTKTPTETYWFYNEFFKIFPNGWLLQYNDNKDAAARANLSHVITMPSITQEQALVFLIYMPSIMLSFFFCLPVLMFMLLPSLLNVKKVSKADMMSTWEHARVILFKLFHFLQRRLVDSPHNLEVDFIMGYKDPLPFFVKNHVQVVSRLVSSLVTGVEWKKIDF